MVVWIAVGGFVALLVLLDLATICSPVQEIARCFTGGRYNVSFPRLATLGPRRTTSARSPAVSGRDHDFAH